MPDTWIDPVIDELTADAIRDQQIAELQADVAYLKRKDLENDDWRRGIYHTSARPRRPAPAIGDPDPE